MTNRMPNFVSCYRIEGVPILPPLMTNEKRVQMREYRELAIAKEKQKKLPSPKAGSSSPFANQDLPKESPPNVTSVNSKLQQQPLLTIDQELCNYLNLSEIRLDGDVVTLAAAEQNELAVDCESMYMQISSMLNNSKQIVAEQTSDMQTVDEPGNLTDMGAGDSRTESDERFHTADELNVDESQTSIDRPECVSSLYDDGASVAELRCINTPCPPSPGRPRMIRSNSYTLDGPSPLFLQHLQQLQQNVNADSFADEPDKSANCINIINFPPNQIKPIAKHTDLSKKTSKSKVVSMAKNCGKTQSKARRPTFESIYGSRLAIRSAISTGGGGGGPNRKSTGASNTNRCNKLNSVKSFSPATATTTLSTAANNNKLKSPACARIRNIYDPKAAAAAMKRANISSGGSNTSDGIVPRPHTVSSSSSRSSVPPPLHDDSRLIEFVTQMELERKRQMDLLIERQEVEQRKMQENFMRQQEMLIKQITDNCSTMLNCYHQEAADIAKDLELNQPAAAAPMATTTTVSNTIVNVTTNQFVTVSSLDESDKVQNETYDEAATIVVSNLCETENNNVVVMNKDLERFCAAATRQTNKTHRKLVFENNANGHGQIDDQLILSNAATKINAYVRGYLTRRLFKTEDVQTLVKMIRDTLMFIIDLHNEQSLQAYTSDADFNLKRSLINQLNSACYSLNDIFMGKTKAEQMEIIETDRQIIKAKLRKLKSAVVVDPAPIQKSVSRNIHKLSKINL